MIEILMHNNLTRKDFQSVDDFMNKMKSVSLYLL